jgi:hypothetical protein
MRISKLFWAAVLLLTTPAAATSQGVSPIACTVIDSGHTIKIFGSNPTAKAIVCTKAECTATTTAGNFWLCQIETQRTIPAGASKVPLGSCSGSDRTAASVKVSALSCN